MNFLEKLKPHLLSDDLLAQEFVIRAVEKCPNIPAEWTELLLKDAAESKEKEKLISLRIDHFPFNEESVKLLLERIETGNKMTRHLYLRPLLKLEPELAVTLKDDLKKHLSQESSAFYELLLHGSEEAVWEEYGTVLAALEKEPYYNGVLYDKAKQLARTIVNKGWIEEWEIDDALQEELEDEYFSYNGILNVYMAGMLKIEKHIPMLAGLLSRDEDILLEETADALISFQSDIVVKEVLRHIPDDDFPIFHLSVLGNTKTPLALQELLKLYETVEDQDMETLIIEKVCLQLNSEAFPIIDRFMEKGYVSSLFDIEELVYGFYKVMGEDHPDLEKWKQTVDKREQARIARQRANEPHRIEKIGRNDPCPCGSGKKYKKCCGA